tara:strand:+ start:98 stop:496 length:399 start_codon:yes stop_codon:yes gene_type:complete
MEKIQIYTNENCPYCKQIKEELNKNGFGYEEKQTSKHEDDWLKATNIIGMATVPTIYYNDEYFVAARDFGNPEHLMNILKNYKKPVDSYSKINFERIKTLNYNTNMAFGRLDQLLRQIETKLNKEDEHKSND